MSFFQIFSSPPNIEKLKTKHNINGLIKALSYQEREIARGAAKALGEIKESRSVPPLIAILSDNDFGLRNAAILALGEIGDPSAVQSLVPFLKSPSSKEAAKALTQLDWQPSFDDFGAKYWIECENWEKCAEIGAPAVPTLSWLVEFSKSTGATQGAAYALGKIGDARAVEPLVSSIKNSSPEEREIILQAIKNMPSGDVAMAVAANLSIMRVPNSDQERAAVDNYKNLIRNLSSDVLDQMIVALHDKDPKIRERAAEVLGLIEDVHAEGALIEAVTDSERYVRQQAVDALRKIGTLRSVQPLINASLKKQDLMVSLELENIYKRESTNSGKTQIVNLLIAGLDKPGWHFQICRALGETGDPRAVDALSKILLNDEDAETRGAAARGLANIGDPRAITPLVAALIVMNNIWMTALRKNPNARSRTLDNYMSTAREISQSIAKFEPSGEIVTSIIDKFATQVDPEVLEETRKHSIPNYKGTIHQGFAASALQKKHASAEEPQINGISTERAMWLFACYDHDRVSAMSLFSNTAHYFSEEHAIETVRSRLSINENETVKFVKPSDWGAPNAIATATSFNIDMERVKSAVVKYLEPLNYRRADIQKALTNSLALPNPGMGILLICVDLRNVN